MEIASSPFSAGIASARSIQSAGLRRLIRSALLEEQDVDDDVGSGRRAHGAFGQAHGADEIGHGGEKHAGRRIGLVHGPAARDEGRESARPQAFDRPRDEIIVERQVEPAGGIVGADGAAAERRVADDEVVSLGDARLGEVLGADARVRMEEVPIRAVIGSISTPVSVVLVSSASGMRAKKRPVPHPGSRTRPPEKPMRRRARQMARTMNSGVKCAYCVTRARLASSAGETSCSRSSPRVAQPFGKASSADRRKRLLASSLAPKDVKRARRSCSSGVAFRASSSISSINPMAAMLSAARVFQSGARRRAPVRRKLRAGTTTGAGASSSVSAIASSIGSPKERPE